jgi:hypothetical protein
MYLLLLAEVLGEELLPDKAVPVEEVQAVIDIMKIFKYLETKLMQLPSEREEELRLKEVWVHKETTALFRQSLLEEVAAGLQLMRLKQYRRQTVVAEGEGRGKMGLQVLEILHLLSPFKAIPEGPVQIPAV